VQAGFAGEAHLRRMNKTCPPKPNPGGHVRYIHLGNLQQQERIESMERILEEFFEGSRETFLQKSFLSVP